jgi:hypothetical protein
MLPNAGIDTCEEFADTISAAEKRAGEDERERSIADRVFDRLAAFADASLCMRNLVALRVDFDASELFAGKFQPS